MFRKPFRCSWQSISFSCRSPKTLLYQNMWETQPENGHSISPVDKPGMISVYRLTLCICLYLLNHSPERIRDTSRWWRILCHIAAFKMLFSEGGIIIHLQQSPLLQLLLQYNTPAVETTSRNISSLHPLVKVLQNYTVTNPQHICSAKMAVILASVIHKNDGCECWRTGTVSSCWVWEELGMGYSTSYSILSLLGHSFSHLAVSDWGWVLQARTHPPAQAHRHLLQEEHLSVLENAINHILGDAEASAAGWFKS